MTNKKQRWKFALGTKVRVKGVRKGTARIEWRHPSIAQGAVFLDAPIDGTQWWNEDALVRVTSAKERQLHKVKRRLKGTKVRPHMVRGHFKLTTRNDGGPRSVYVDKHVRGER